MLTEFLWQKFLCQWPLGRPEGKWKGTTKMDLKEVGSELCPVVGCCISGVEPLGECRILT